jgi:hypothetical protein
MGSNMILTIGALVLFGTFLSSSNRLMTGNTQIATQNEYNLTALALAQSVIDEAKIKAFDEATVTTSVISPVFLTAPGSLRNDGSAESTPTPDTLASNGFASIRVFDDIDDYNGYTRRVNTPRADGYNISVSVGYASETYPDSAKSTQTYAKKMTVTVTSNYISQPLTLSYNFTY